MVPSPSLSIRAKIMRITKGPIIPRCPIMTQPIIPPSPIPGPSWSVDGSCWAGIIGLPGLCWALAVIAPHARITADVVSTRMCFSTAKPPLAHAPSAELRTSKIGPTAAAACRQIAEKKIRQNLTITPGRATCGEEGQGGREDRQAIGEAEGGLSDKNPDWL